MKKFLALLFVSAALTSMAAVPHVNTNAQVRDGKPVKSMVLKTQSMAQKMTANVMKANPVQQFFAENKLTPADNKLMKKAPRRVSADDVLASKITFLEGFEFNNDSGKLVEAVQHYTGGWETEMEQTGDGTFNAYMYFTGIPFQINVDYSAKTAEMVMEQLGGWQWSDTVVSGKTTTITDTTEYMFIVNEEFLMDENADEFTNVQGELYDDGTIYFPGGWVVYGIDYVKKTVTRNGNVISETNDTVPALFSDFIHNTYLMTATGTHSYTTHYSKDLVDQYVAQGYPASEFAPVDETVPVYMFQYNDTTVVAWNVFGMGSRGRAINIFEDGTMNMLGDVSYEASNGRDYENISVGWDAVADTANWNNASYMTVGTVTNNEITWGESCLYDFNTGYYLIAYFGNNVLKFTNGDQFLLGNAAAPTIQVTEGDEAYTFTAVSEEDGVVVYMLSFDPETGNITGVLDNPYIVERTDVDQTIYLAAIADGEPIGKNLSEVVGGEFVVPALEEVGMPGDVDNNGIVNITDVTTLISAVMSENLSTINADNADMNGDGTINVTDITLLISMVMAQ